MSACCEHDYAHTAASLSNVSCMWQQDLLGRQPGLGWQAHELQPMHPEFCTDKLIHSASSMHVKPFLQRLSEAACVITSKKLASSS